MHTPSVWPPVCSHTSDMAVGELTLEGGREGRGEREGEGGREEGREGGGGQVERE